MDAFAAACARGTEELVEFMAPGVAARQATKGWPLQRLDHALYVLAFYLAVVGWGVYKKTTQPAAARKARAERPRQRLSVMESFRQEPIKAVQAGYNLVQVVLCTWMLAGTFLATQHGGYRLACNAFNPEATGLAYWVWVFFLSKILDFADTFFMVWRGNYRQITYLHVYHHISIYLVVWMDVNAGYDGDIYLSVAANCAVHLVMYFYYFLTSLQFRPPWKMLVTVMQLTQFAMMNVQAFMHLARPECPYPRNITLFYLWYIISLFCLFMNFFVKSYCRRRPRKAKRT